MTARSHQDFARPGRGVILLFLLVAIVPPLTALLGSGHPPFRPGVDVVRDFAMTAAPAEFAVILVALLRFGFAGFTRAIPRPIWLLLGVWLLFHLWSTLQYAAFDLASVRAMLDILHVGYALSLAVFLGGLDQRDQKIFAFSVLCGWAFFLLGLILYIASIPTRDGFDWLSFGYATRNVRPLAALVAMASAFALGQAVLAKDKRAQWLALALFVLGLAFVGGSGSRGPFLALFVAIGFAFAASHAELRKKIALYTASGSIVALPIALAWAPDTVGFGLARIFGIGAMAAPGGGNGRVEIWLATIEKMRDLPFQGFGRDRFMAAVDIGYNFPHNVMLQYWFDWGWIGGTAALLILAAIFISGATKLRHFGAALGSFLAVTCALLNALIDGTLYDGITIFVFATFAALMTVQCAASSPRRSATAPTRSPTT